MKPVDGSDSPERLQEKKVWKISVFSWNVLIKVFEMIVYPLRRWKTLGEAGWRARNIDREKRIYHLVEGAKWKGLGMMTNIEAVNVDLA